MAQEKDSQEKDKGDARSNAPDVENLFTWANFKGGSYRDFSGSRDLVRARHREVTEQEELAREAVWQVANPAPRLTPSIVQAPVPVPSTSHLVAPLVSPLIPPLISPLVYPIREASRDKAKVLEMQDETQAGPLEDASTLDEPAWIRAHLGASGTTPTARRDGALREALPEVREHAPSRWFALQGVFEDSDGNESAAPSLVALPAPSMGVFSLAGGVGKTTIVATLGRVLSEYGEKVLLVDTTSCGLLPFYFGARELRPGLVRTFSPPTGSTDAQIQLVSMESGDFFGGAAAPDAKSIAQDLRRFGRGTHRVLVDLATGPGPMIRPFLSLAPTLLIPIAPDMNSVVSINLLDAFLRTHVDAGAPPVNSHFLLNNFDASLPLHLDVREMLRGQLGDRLLPFVLHRSATVSEALAEGMTVVDYAPDSAATEDFKTLANWISRIAPASTAGLRGMRWSER